MPRTAGNLLLCSVYVTGANAITVTGWNAVSGTDINLGGRRVNLFWLVAVGGDAAPAPASTSASKMFAFLEEFSGNDTSAPLQATSVGSVTQAAPVSGTGITATMGAAPGSSGGMSVTSYGVHLVSATATEAPGSGWLNGTNSASGVGGAFGSSAGADNAHSGGDVHYNPATGSADSELITITTAGTMDNFVALIAFFKASTPAISYLMPRFRNPWELLPT